VCGNDSRKERKTSQISWQEKRSAEEKKKKCSQNLGAHQKGGVNAGRAPLEIGLKTNSENIGGDILKITDRDSFVLEFQLSIWPPCLPVLDDRQRAGATLEGLAPCLCHSLASNPAGRRVLIY